MSNNIFGKILVITQKYLIFERTLDEQFLHLKLDPLEVHIIWVHHRQRERWGDVQNDHPFLSTQVVDKTCNVINKLDQNIFRCNSRISKHIVKKGVINHAYPGKYHITLVSYFL